jgi:hypothetical protein
MTDLRLERPNRVESYTDTELAKLWPQMEALKYEDVYIYVARAAVATGARLGELVASTGTTSASANANSTSNTTTT